MTQGVIWTNYLLSCLCANPLTQFSGEDSAYFMRKTLEDLSEMQDLPDEGFPHRKQVTVLYLSWRSSAGFKIIVEILEK